MKAPRTLKTRIVFYFCGYLAALLALYLGALLVVFRGAEDLAFNRQIAQIADKLALEIEARGRIPEQLPALVTAYTDFMDIPPALRDYVRDQPPSVFEINKDDLGYHAAIKPLSTGRTLYVFYDVTSIKATDRFESYMVLALFATGLGVLIMGWGLARTLANRILNPVSRLAETVRSLPIDKETVALRAFTSNDEVGLLAGTIDQLLKRISAFTRREREFTAHASHELRTPVTVIKGAVEIITQKGDKEDNALQRPLKRIQRAVRDIEMLIDTFLLLARQDQLPARDETCSLPAIADTVAKTYGYLLEGKAVDVKVRSTGSVTVQAPPSLVTIALGNLVRNAFQHTMRGEVEILVLADRVRVSDSGPGFDATKPTAGLGLTIVSRLCERMRWQFDITGQPGRGTRAELNFSQKLENIFPSQELP